MRVFYRLWAIVACALAASLAAPATAGDAPDYSQTSNWICRPGAEDTCTTGLDAVVEGPAGRGKTLTFTSAKDPAIDCFYVYPTVSKEQSVYSDLQDSPEIADATKRQAGRLSSRCRVFAPIYRQVTLYGLRKVMSGEIADGFNESYNDVAAAWAYYLAHDNGGRGVVLVGHSQGTILLQRLIATTIDGTPQQKLLVSAFLAGDPSLAIPKGKRVGGTFAHVPVCSSKAQTGCAYAWGSYLEGDTSPLFAFGTPLDNGMTSACENPATPSGGTGALQFYRHNADAGPGEAPFIEIVDELTGTCRADSTGSGFIVSVRPGARATTYKTLLKNYEILSGWGLHVADIALVQGNMLDVLDAEIATWKAR